MKKTLLTLYIAVLFLGNVTAQENVKWYSIDEADKLLKSEPKPLFIDAYTDWCGWCKKFDKDTFSDPVIAKYLNDNYYPIKFNAESKEPVTFLGRQFINDGSAGNAHQLAVSLMRGQMSYPTVVFLNEKGELIAPVPGYKGPIEFEPLLVYFAEKKYLTQKWEEFIKSFKGSF